MPVMSCVYDAMLAHWVVDARWGAGSNQALPMMALQRVWLRRVG